VASTSGSLSSSEGRLLQFYFINVNPSTAQPAGARFLEKRTSKVDVVPVYVELSRPTRPWKMDHRNDRISDIRLLLRSTGYTRTTFHPAGTRPCVSWCHSSVQVTGTDDWGPGCVAHDSNFSSVGVCPSLMDGPGCTQGPTEASRAPAGFPRYIPGARVSVYDLQP
jgi:hypothetical protein